MKFSTFLKISCLFFMCQNVFATSVANSHRGMILPLEGSHFGTAGFSSGPDHWYTVATNSYPDVTPISRDRNIGTSNGRVYLSPTGFTIGEAGNYLATVSAVLINPNPTSLIIPVFLVVDDVFDPSDINPVGGVGSVTDDALLTIQGTGILKNVAEGARLSVVATNGGYPTPQDITVVSWGITLYKLPDNIQ